MKKNETTKEMVIRKLTSRKLWVSLISFISAIMIFYHCPESEVNQVSAIIMAGAVAISYIIGEGMTDIEHNDDTDEEDKLNG